MHCFAGASSVRFLRGDSCVRSLAGALSLCTLSLGQFPRTLWQLTSKRFCWGLFDDCFHLVSSLCFSWGSGFSLGYSS